ncbi:hypothetical protein GDO78_009742 [Eleutherodactylus coqui]|uniref:Uncharacterized protein n=1 Tax=Eleutherodactylus coqui TaxID=57060 RepID=A0A8J6F9H4_ELECQ|nr:hypothetical protein GDO78_009742 [Eleutherodactylus coqui]
MSPAFMHVCVVVYSQSANITYCRWRSCSVTASPSRHTELLVGVWENNILSFSSVSQETITRRRARQQPIRVQLALYREFIVRIAADTCSAPKQHSP